MKNKGLRSVALPANRNLFLNPVLILKQWTNVITAFLQELHQKYLLFWLKNHKTQPPEFASHTPQDGSQTRTTAMMVANSFTHQKIFKLNTHCNNASKRFILATVSSLPNSSAISNICGPNLPPTSIIRKGSNNSPGFI